MHALDFRDFLLHLYLGQGASLECEERDIER